MRGVIFLQRVKFLLFNRRYFFAYSDKFFAHMCINFEEKPENLMNLTNSQKKLINKIQTESGSLKPETEYQNLMKRVKTQEGEEEDKKHEEKKEEVKEPKKMFVNPLKLKNPQEKDFRLDSKAYIRLRQIEESNKHSSQTEGKVSSSFTSTSLTPITKNEFRQKSEEEIRKEFYHFIRTQQLKGKVEICTNLGNLMVNLHWDFVPKTWENFLELWESGYYNKVIFHRLIPEFMIQGGDPTGTGTGGMSYYGKKFEDEFHTKLAHSKRGVLSMANSGANTNGSQFFITFAPWNHLDGKHSAFGEVIAGKEILDIMEAVPTEQGDRPTKKIRIIETIVHTNPFRDIIATQLQKQFDNEKKERDELKGGTWTSYKDKGKISTTENKISVIGKYLLPKPT